MERKRKAEHFYSCTDVKAGKEAEKKPNKARQPAGGSRPAGVPLSKEKRQRPQGHKKEQGDEVGKNTGVGPGGKGRKRKKAPLL